MSRTSVVLATFNGERFLEPLLASLAAQHRQPFELVVSDDGSTDSTLDIVDAFAGRASFPVSVMRHAERVGHAANFLRGLLGATGEYVAWCDQDDVWSPRKLQRCEVILDRLHAQLVIHGARRIDADGRPLGALRGMRAPIQRRLRGERFSVPHGFRQVFRRDLYANITAADRPPSIPGHEPALHDEWTFLLANANGSVVWLPMALADYRVHGDNLTDADVMPSVWAQSVGARADDPNRLRARAAGERADHLRLVGARRTGSARDTPLASAAAYERLAQTYVDRTALYDASGRGPRLRVLAQLVRGRAYRAGPGGGLGLRGLARDLLEVVR